MPEKNNAADFQDITRRLNVIIYLLLDKKRSEGKSNREIIKELSEFGLKDTEICTMLGKSRSYVASELTQIKKGAKKKVKENEG